MIKRTEHLLNRAISYSASALNWVIDQVGGFTCKRNPYAGDILSWVGKDVFESVATDVIFKGFFKAMITSGLSLPFMLYHYLQSS